MTVTAALESSLALAINTNTKTPVFLLCSVAAGDPDGLRVGNLSRYHPSPGTPTSGGPPSPSLYMDVQICSQPPSPGLLPEGSGVTFHLPAPEGSGASGVTADQDDVPPAKGANTLGGPACQLTLSCGFLLCSRSDVLVLTPWLAPIVWEGTFNIDILNAQFQLQNATIGLTVFAIKKYVVFLKLFLETAEKYFMVGHKVNYYVFTDRPADVPPVPLQEGRQVVVLQVRNYTRWQDVSMHRMEMISSFSRQRFLREVDYLVCADVDMKFSDHVGVEILSSLFGTLHPGFYAADRQAFTYERRPLSQAYIPRDEGDFYYVGSFFGGSVLEVHRLTKACHQAMMVDEANHIEAVWHDESHLNKYLLYHKPTKVLSPEYVWDERMLRRPPFLRKLRYVAVPKNHQAIRN
ncbi:histo-blood group ABO system transferase [Loxodonta africana]|uniref:histo-blood group ABO system transferase n=1 Tax=Loxodonta africana TaxID=9785 RepID=UPI0030CCFDF5